MVEKINLLINFCKAHDIRIDALGFFKIDLPLIVKIVGTVVTYTVILVQVREFQTGCSHVPRNCTL